MIKNDLILNGMTTNNLRNVTLTIPKNKVTVFTGVSGSGKSSIVFDTIANEAQRQLNQTFSAFVQGFLPKVEKPDVVSIENLNPAIIIDQKRIGGNSRSTLGTITDVQSYLRLIYSRVGQPYIGAGHMFSFNDPDGMCPECDGIGKQMEPIFDKLIDMNLSLKGGAIIFPPFAVDSWYWQAYEASGYFDMDLPLNEYSEVLLDKLLYGKRERIKYSGMGMKDGTIDYEGVIPKFRRLYITRDLSKHGKRTQEITKEYAHFSSCSTCGGKRYNPHILSAKINGLTIYDVGELELSDLDKFLSKIDNEEVAPILHECQKRIRQLINMSLDYLTLNRETSTLSGGESQRVKMMKHLSSSLNGMLYIFDEPSVGLHPRDVKNLNNMLLELRDKGNTVIVVEHDRDVIKIADHVVDVGPKAGIHGGEITFEGTYQELLKSDTLTGKHLLQLPDVKVNPKPFTETFDLKHCRTNNLKDLDVQIPKGILNVITGVAGSGKSSLIHQEFINAYPETILIDQKPLHASSRSNILTYTGIFDKVRALYAKMNKVDKAFFSFNSKGACEKCGGRGITYTDLAFMEGVESVCSDCNGDRYKKEVLEYNYKEKNIVELLDMTVEEATDFFEDKTIQKTFKMLCEVGVDYLTLGQSMDSLSGGECQRIKLASELHKEGNAYILDEPTTGLHMSDIDKFMEIINRLVNQNSTVIIIEHNIEVMRQADWIIDLGPEAGGRGGTVVFEGHPKDLLKSENSITANYI